LCVFHLGVASALIKHNIITEQSKFSGASGGALIAAVLGCKIPIQKALEGLSEISADCRKNGTVGRVGKPLLNTMKKMLPDDC
jgi:predicted acylesterase/phospholipase RssA